MAIAALIGPGVGAAAADDLKPDPATPSAGPVAQKGIRSQAVQGDLREADKGVVLAQGDVRGSNEAVPTTKGESPQPGNLSNLGYDCLFVWSQFCQ
ncbi:hypothetical protein [Mycolicibacterium palauense]|uniref:hypothetical protein n=1 Tax=Mycolicibacterium palauense TaxID=2034511 RepID=UPI001145C156|nr:hypothetical protein [Mycolicibacterium palauense]